MSLLNKHIFISKDPSQVLDLQKPIDNAGGILYARAFIRFESSNAETTPYTDIIFFSSPRSVNYYLQHHSINANTRVGCVGKSTAHQLVKFGFEPNFVGADHRSIDEIAEDFKKFAENSSVLFPVSNISLGTIASKIHKEKRTVIEVYRTIFDSITIGSYDVYIFTSPSNVRSFLLKNNVAKDAFVIAWGNSTEQELTQSGIHCKKLGTPSLECLIEKLESERF